MFCVDLLYMPRSRYGILCFKSEDLASRAKTVDRGSWMNTRDTDLGLLITQKHCEACFSEACSKTCFAETLHRIIFYDIY